MNFEQIIYEVNNRIALITLNRPDQLNAWTVTMMNEFIEALGVADADDNVRVVVVTGEGKAFCAGMDLSVGGNVFGLDESQLPDMADMEARCAGDGKIDSVRDTGGLVALAIYECNKPVIAAINGAAVGIAEPDGLADDSGQHTALLLPGRLPGRCRVDIWPGQYAQPALWPAGDDRFKPPAAARQRCRLAHR